MVNLKEDNYISGIILLIICCYVASIFLTILISAMTCKKQKEVYIISSSLEEIKECFDEFDLPPEEFENLCLQICNDEDKWWEIKFEKVSKTRKNQKDGFQ